MRTYYVCLQNDQGDRFVHHVPADWYSQAEDRAVTWANNHADHAKYGPWHATHCEVAA